MFALQHTERVFLPFIVSFVFGRTHIMSDYIPITRKLIVCPEVKVILINLLGYKYKFRT